MSTYVCVVTQFICGIFLFQLSIGKANICDIFVQKGCETEVTFILRNGEEPFLKSKNSSCGDSGRIRSEYGSFGPISGGANYVRGSQIISQTEGIHQASVNSNQGSMSSGDSGSNGRTFGSNQNSYGSFFNSNNKGFQKTVGSTDESFRKSHNSNEQAGITGGNGQISFEKSKTTNDESANEKNDASEQRKVFYQDGKKITEISKQRSFEMSEKREMSHASKKVTVFN